jgi:hypothetical protein
VAARKSRTDQEQRHDREVPETTPENESSASVEEAVEVFRRSSASLAHMRAPRVRGGGGVREIERLFVDPVYFFDPGAFF